MSVCVFVFMYNYVSLCAHSLFVFVFISTCVLISGIVCVSVCICVPLIHSLCVVLLRLIVL